MYFEVICFVDGIFVEVFVGVDQEYKVMVEQFEVVCIVCIIVFVFVFLLNLIGLVYIVEEIKVIGEWVFEYGIWIISDEIYQNFIYEGVKVILIVEVVFEVVGQMIFVNGVVKIYVMIGWWVGWMVGFVDVIKIVGNLQLYFISNVNNVVQKVVIVVFNGLQDEVEQM